MMMTQVLVSFGQPGTVDVKFDVDLTMLLGSPERYYEVATEPPDKQQEDVRRIVPRVVDNLQLFVGPQRLQLVFRGFAASKAQKADFLDASMSKLSTLSFVAALPPGATGPLKLVVPLGAEVDYPIAYTVQIPAAHVSVTRWVEEGMHESDPYALGGQGAGGRGPHRAGRARAAVRQRRRAGLQPRRAAVAKAVGPVPAPRLPSHRPRGRRSHSVRARPVLPGHHLAQAPFPDDRLHGRPRDHAVPVHLRDLQPAESLRGAGDRPVDRLHRDRERREAEVGTRGGWRSCLDSASFTAWGLPAA